MSVGKGSIARATGTKVEKAQSQVKAEAKAAPKKAAPKAAAPKKAPAKEVAKPAAKKVERPDNLKVTNTIYEVGQELPMYLM